MPETDATTSTEYMSMFDQAVRRIFEGPPQHEVGTCPGCGYPEEDCVCDPDREYDEIPW